MVQLKLTFKSATSGITDSFDIFSFVPLSPDELEYISFKNLPDKISLLDSTARRFVELFTELNLQANTKLAVQNVIGPTSRIQRTFFFDGVVYQKTTFSPHVPLSDPSSKMPLLLVSSLPQNCTDIEVSFWKRWVLICIPLLLDEVADIEHRMIAPLYSSMVNYCCYNLPWVGSSVGWRVR
jgi:hypothetical protein